MRKLGFNQFKSTVFQAIPLKHVSIRTNFPSISPFISTYAHISNLRWEAKSRHTIRCYIAAIRKPAKHRMRKPPLVVQKETIVI